MPSVCLRGIKPRFDLIYISLEPGILLNLRFKSCLITSSTRDDDFKFRFLIRVSKKEKGGWGESLWKNSSLQRDLFSTVNMIDHLDFHFHFLLLGLSVNDTLRIVPKI